MSEIEPLVRKTATGEARTEMLTVRVHAGSLAAIDELATQRGWSRADTVRSLLRAGMDLHRKGAR